MTDLRTAVSVSKTSSVTSLHILQLIHESFLDKNYQTDAYWKVIDMKKIDSPQLENSFQQKKLEMEQERTPEELKEEYLFTCYKSDEHINVIAFQGLNVQQSKFNFLGDSLLGVILCKHADIQLKAAQNEYQPKCWLMVFKVLCGRKLAVHPAGNVIRKPTDGADCHISSIPPVLGETLGCQAIKSQVYLYETDPTSVTGYALRPRQCVPQAYVEFVSCFAPATSIPPVAHLPHPGIIQHQRISSPSSHQTLALEMGLLSPRFPRTSTPVGCDVPLVRPPVGVGQQFPPYVSKSSSSLRNRQRSGPVKISQPANSNPTYSGMVNSSHLSWQQRAAGPFVGDSCNNRSRIEDDASMVNSGHVSWQELATGSRVSEDCSNPILMENNSVKVLVLNRNLVIGLLQTFAKEMNAVAGVWRASGCSVENTSCLTHAILAVQELRLLFTQIAPVCQQFYRYAQDLFAGNTDNFPSLAVVQHQLKCLRTCQSTMSTAFKNFREVLAQNTDSMQKGIMMAQEVLSKKFLLLHCLTTLQSTLVAFNSFHTNHLPSVVNEEHAKQNVPDLPVQSSAGVLYNSQKHLLLKQPVVPTTAPRTTSTISPSLASLLAMSGGDIGHLATSSRQDYVSCVGIKNNGADKLQHQVTSPSDYRMCSQRTMLCERPQAQSDTSLAENSTFQFGLRLPIVIAPDDEFIDEVVDLSSTSAGKNTESVPLLTSIKQEKTSSRDKRSVTETIFIDVDEVTPEYFEAKHEEVGGDGEDMTMSSTTDGLMLDILDEQNPDTSLARVFCISPDEMDESRPDCIQPYVLLPSHTNMEQQSPTECLAEADTAVEDCSLKQTLTTSDDLEFASSAKDYSTLVSSQSVEVNDETENVEPEFAINIEPTTEELSGCKPALSQTLNLHSQTKQSDSLITAVPKTVTALSDVCDAHIICSEKDTLQLGKTSVNGAVEVDSILQTLELKKKKSFKQKPKGFVKYKKLIFLRKFQHWARRSQVRKKPALVKEILTSKRKSVKLKHKASKALLKKSKQREGSEMIDAGDISAKVSDKTRSHISEIAEVIVKPGLDKTDDAITENLSVEGYPVTESQIQDSLSQDLCTNCKDTAYANFSEKTKGPDLASSCDSDISETSTRSSSFLVTSISNYEATFRDEQPCQNTDSDVRAIERNKAPTLVCEKTFIQSTDLPLRPVKFEPLITDFDSTDEQKSRFLQNQRTTDDEIIAEVVANAAEFDSNSVDDADDDSGFLKIRIENVCSIAPEGFESMDYSTYFKTETEANVEDCAEYVSSEVATEAQSSFKIGHTGDYFGAAAAVRMNDVTSEVATDVEGTSSLIGSSEATSKVIRVVQPTCLKGASDSQTVAKELTVQEEEIIDVGDAEYSVAVGSSAGQSLVKTSVIKDKVSDIVHGENFDDCDIEFDVLYENMSDENEDKFKDNEQNLSKCKGDDESEISFEVLKFYSMGGDNYETADVNSTLDLMSLSVKKAPSESNIGAESGRKQVKKRKRNRSSGRKRKRKKSTSNAVAKATKGRLPIENQDSKLVLPLEKNSETVSECVVESGEEGCIVENSVSPGSSGKRRKRCTRKQVQESKVNAFLVSPEVEKLCSTLAVLGPGSTTASNRDGKRVNNENIDFHGESLCSEPWRADLLGKVAGNLRLPKSDKINKADEQENELVGEENEEICEESCEKDLQGVEDLHQGESDINTSHIEKDEATKTKKRRRRYAMTGRSKRRKRPASQQQNFKTVKKCCQNVDKSDTNHDAVETTELGDGYKTVQTELSPPYYYEDKKCANIPELVLNLFVKGTSPDDLSAPRGNRACGRKRKPKSRLQRISKLGKNRKTFSSSALKSVDSSPESTLLDILNDNKFLESLKSAVKAVEGSSSMFENSSEPAVKGGSSEKLETSVEESNPVYFTDITNSLLGITEDSKSSHVNAEPVDANSDSVDYLNYWKSSSEEHLNIDSLGNSKGTFSNPCAANSEVQTSQCSTLSSAVTSVSYSALISAVDNASSSISYDAIRNALKTIASSNGMPPKSMTETTETGELCDNTEISLHHNSVEQFDVSKKTTGSDSAQSSSSNFPTSKRAADTSNKDSLLGRAADTSNKDSLLGRTADTSNKDSLLGSGHASAKTVIPLSVYLRNVRQSNYKNIKDMECSNEPAFYTGVVKAAAECPTYSVNQSRLSNNSNNQICSRDPRLARMMRQQSSVMQTSMQLEQQFQYNSPKMLPAYYSNVNSIEEAVLQKEMGSPPTTILTSPLQNRGSFPGYFHSFSSPENQMHSNPGGKKPVCSITPFIHQSEKSICSEQQSDAVPTKQNEATLPSKPSRDGSWQLIPISNLPPRPPIIFARLPLSERKIDGFPTDPRIRSERELSVRRQLSRPDNVCDDVPLVIDAADAAASIIKSRRTSGAKANVVSKESNNWEDTASKTKDWYLDGKYQDKTVDVTKPPWPQNQVRSQGSKSRHASADDILEDLLLSLHNESFEGERSANMEAGMLCGLNRVLGKRSHLTPKSRTSEQQQQKCHSSIDGLSPALIEKNLDSESGPDHKNCDKQDQVKTTVDQSRKNERDHRSHSRTNSSKRHHTKDYIHSKRDHSSRRDIHHLDHSRTHDAKSGRKSHVEPLLDRNSKDSAVSSVHKDAVNKETENSDSDVPKKTPNEECMKKRQHSMDEKVVGADERKRSKESHLPSSHTHKDERPDQVKSLHNNKDVNLKCISETKREKGRRELNMHDAKSHESTDVALQKGKSLKMHSSGVDKNSKSCVRQHDNKEHSRILPSKSAKKSVETDNEKNNHKEIRKSEIQSQGSNSSKERQCSRGKEKHLHRREHEEKRHLSHNNMKEHTKVKEGDCSRSSHSTETLHPEGVESLTAYSDAVLQQNLMPTDGVHCDVNDVDTESKTVNDDKSTDCAFEQVESNAAALSRVTEEGTLATEDFALYCTDAEGEQEDGSLVIHMEDVGDNKDSESHLESTLAKSSCMGTDLHGRLKASDANRPEKNCVFATSLCSVADEISPSDEKKLADEVGERDGSISYQSCYAGEPFTVAPRSNTEIRADILKSIRSLKSLLEDKLKSDVEVSDVDSDSQMLMDNATSTDTSAEMSSLNLLTASEEGIEQQTFVKTLNNEMQKGDFVSFSPYSDTEFDKELEQYKELVINKLTINLETEDSSPYEHSKTSESNRSAHSADGLSEKSDSRIMSFGGNFKVLSKLSSDDLGGSLSQAELTGKLQPADGSNPRRDDASSDLSTKSDNFKSSLSLLTSVQRTKSLFSSVFVNASDNTLVTTDQPKSASAALTLMEFSDTSYQGRVSCGMPYSTDEASLDLRLKCPESEEKDAAANELRCTTKENVDSITEKSEKGTLRQRGDESSKENLKNPGDQERKDSNLANVGKLVDVQNVTVNEGENADLTGSHYASDLAVTESSAMMACSHSGEDEGMDKARNTMEVSGRYSPPSAINQPAEEKCASPESEQTVLGINAGADEHSTSQGTGKLLEMKSEFNDWPSEPSNSSSGSCTVNNRKVRAADFFKDVFCTGNAYDLVTEDTRNIYQLEANSQKVTESEVILPDNLLQILPTSEIPSNSKMPVVARTEMEMQESQLGNVLEMRDKCESVGSSELAEPSSSSKPSVFSRLGRRRRGKIADEWSNISSGWTEMSRDYDEPAGRDESVVGTSDCTEIPADVPVEALAAYKEVFKKEMAMTEQKIINGHVFIDPCDGLSDCQIKKLLRTKSASPDLEQELQLECEILELDKDVSRLQDCMEKIRNQLSRFPSPALDRTYDEVEQKYNFLLVKKELFQYRLTELRRYQKSHFVHVVPSEFLFDDEIGKYISLEGMLLFLHKPTISVLNCVRLAALKTEILQTQDVVAKTNVKQAEDIQRLKIKLGWLHLQRKVLLQEICCTTERGQKRLMQYLADKLAWYRGLQSEIDGAGDQQAEDVHSFIRETIDAFESYVRTLKSVQKSVSHGRWTLDATQTFRKRGRSRSQSESRNPDFADRSLVKKRRQAADVHLEGSDFDQGANSQGGWQRAGSSSFYNEEDPRSSEDGGERWNIPRQLKRNLEFEGNRSRYLREQESVDFEDNREQWCRSRYSYHGGNFEDVWHEEERQRWDCQEMNDRFEQSSNMYNRPYYEDTGYDRGWSGHGYSGRYARGWPQRR